MNDHAKIYRVFKGYRWFSCILPLLLIISAKNLCKAGNVKTEAHTYADKWRPLIEAGNFKDARSLCEGWLKAESAKVALAEAHKCMSNVEMEGASRVGVRSDGMGGGSLGESYAGPGVEKAVKHLSEGIALLPGDISIHEARLHILLYSDKVSELPAYLEKSIKAYPKKDGVDYWLNYAPELYGIGEYEVGVAYGKVLEKHYPNDHRVIANVGAFLAVLRRDAEALKYAKRAVEMNPEDQINAWNLGRIYESTDKNQLADKYYRRSLALAQTPDELREHQCTYSEFVEKKLKDFPRACELQKKYCDDSALPACGKSK